MPAIVRNIIAVVVGVVVGSVVNMALINAGPFVIPLPDGADVSDFEKLRESMKTFAPVNFIFPFLAHALGTLVGAFVSAMIAANHKMKFALGIGAFFQIGGFAAAAMLESPLWFNLLDFILAYIPMGFAGGFIASLVQKKKPGSPGDQATDAEVESSSG